MLTCRSQQNEQRYQLAYKIKLELELSENEECSTHSLDSVMPYQKIYI